MKQDIKQRINDMKQGLVSAGYKNTAVGICPIDWKVVKLRDLGSFKKGTALPKTNLRDNGIPCIGYGDIYTKYNVYFENAKSFTNETTANEGQPIEKGTLLFTGTGETAIEIGKCVCYNGTETIYAGGDIILFYPEKINPLFLAMQQNLTFAIRQKASYGQGHSIVHIQKCNIEKLNIIFPLDKVEQSCIVEILMAWDKAVELQENYIEKLELRKKALLQKLLTPQPHWQKKKLGKLGKIVKGVQLNNDCLSANYYYPMFNGGVKSSGYTNHYNRSGENIIISEGGNSCGYVNYVPDKFWSGGHSYTLVEEKIVKLYLYYFLKNMQHEIMRLRVGSGLPNIQKSALESFNIYYPNSLKEQQRIADILTCADDEITLQKQKLDKLKEQRKAMQQLLLTGIVRVG